MGKLWNSFDSFDYEGHHYYRNHTQCYRDDEIIDYFEYAQAWNHHQKSSPHHWQFWCLIQDVDQPQLLPLDMPFEYIIEMLCDWQSAGNHYGNTAYEWYAKQKNKMLLTDKTREIVEKYIEYLK